ncbi:hypothetical protein ASPBRDRAFT_26444 [Aspergillus brasiliensis CBS 101740]|uniref:CFEM domain-containing protein n=1 Tax=Aspergillus brasiliensis (strain CBS 101740 / IMI 381727 / IBT 21946) TaxID=767769 RepID=A0A1L9UW86_ASPBC|nr:hypothetical protein ASPBRDRAFT_26444 [Aspergillus brasiliensis CBS 101740]
MRAVVSLYLLSVSLWPLVALAHPKGLWWGTDECYTSPGKADNDCSQDQQTGFDWSGLAVGSFSAYAGFEFSGFSLKDSFSASRSGKCIVGKLAKGSSSGLRMSSGKDQREFSVSKFRLATSREADVHIVYNMADGSSCNDVVSSSPGGTDVTNDQCGGSVSVSFRLDEDIEIETCDLGIYEVHFDCSPSQDTDSDTSSTTVLPSSTKSSGSSTPLILMPPSSPAADTTSTPTPVRMTTSTVYTTKEVTITSCAPTVTNCPANSVTVVTSTIAVSTTVCPVTETSGASRAPSTSAEHHTSNPVVPTSISVPSGISPVESTSSHSSPIPTSHAVSTAPAASGHGSSAPAVDKTTVVTYVTVTTCPVTSTGSAGGSLTTSAGTTVSTVTLTSTSTICTKCIAPTSVAPISSGPVSVPERTTTVITYETVTTCPLTNIVTSSGVPITSVTSTVSTLTTTSVSTITPTSAASSSAHGPTGVAPISSGPVSVPESTTTVVTYETLTTCPVTTVVTSSGNPVTSVTSTISTVTLTSVSTYCPRCSAGPTSVGPVTTAPESTTTIVTWETLTTYPVTAVVTSSGKAITSVTSTVSTITLTATSTIANTVVPTGKSPATSTGATSVSTPAPSAPCPNVVPKCINTWMNLLPKCSSNSDVSCYCPSDDFTKKVISCIQAWGASQAEVQAALSYFTGICAAYVPQNPGIVTVIPTTITLGAGATSVAPVTGTAVHSTTGGIAPTTKPATAAPVASTVVTYSTWTVTVPRVVFTTASGSTQTTVGLVPGGATGVSANSSRIENPWASSTLATFSGRPTPSHSPSQTPLLSNTGSKEKKTSRCWWTIAVAAALLGIY